MPLRDDLLTPIPGDNPSGVYLRHDAKLGLYDKIKEGRRQDDELAQGDWQHERKLADYPLVAKLTQEALATKTKDLQLAAWLTEALLHVESFAGLRQGITLCTGLLNGFWDTIYPPIEDDDLELRAGPLDFVGTSLDFPLKGVPLTKAGHNWFKYKESRAVGYEDQAKTEKEREARETKISEGKLAPDIFDKAFVETPKAFYLQSEKELDGSLQALKTLEEVCDEKFGTSGPAFGKLKTSLGEVRHTVHALLEKKRETEPDPVEAAPEEAGSEGSAGAAGAAAGTGGSSGVPGITISVLTSSEPAERREAIAAVARVAALLRKQDPHSPAPYLMMRGLRWGELRARGLSDPSLLEAPSTELRQHVKRLALAKKWNELLDTAENAMSLPCGRAWLDLQRLVVGACTALGEEYGAIGSAIRSELKTLLHDLPELLDASLLDDTPSANGETRAWLQQLDGPQAPAATADAQPTEAAASSANGNGSVPSWMEKQADPYLLAQDRLKAGQAEKAFEIMRKEIARQRSGRGRFERTMQLVELCVSAGKDAIAQPLLDDIAAAIENHKLDEWEDKEMVAAALATLMKVSAKIRDDDTEKQKLFERICRLDPVRALSAG